MGRWRLLPALAVLTLGIRPGSDKQAKEGAAAADRGGVSVLAGGGLLLESHERGPTRVAPARPQLPAKRRPQVLVKAAEAALTYAVQPLHVGEPAPGSAPWPSTGMTEVAAPTGCDASSVCVQPANCQKLPSKTTGTVVDAHVQMVKNTCQEYLTLCSRAFCQYEAERAAVRVVDGLLKQHWQGTREQLRELNTSIELSFKNIQELLTQPPAPASKPAPDAAAADPAQVEAATAGDADTLADAALGGPAVAVPAAPIVAEGVAEPVPEVVPEVVPEPVTEESIPQGNSLVGWNLGP